jgi:hypothetical protein
MENATSELLIRDIHKHDISRSLLNMFELNNLFSLRQLIDRPMEEWFEFTGFSQHLLNELINYLDKNSVLPLVRD